METTRASKLPIRSIDDLKEVGKLIGQSGVAGRLNPAQGFIIACICYQTGRSINEFTETYHVVGTRISMRADAMLANLIKMGGEYKILSRTPEKAAVWMKFKSAESDFSLTKEEIFQEPVAYTGGPSEQAKELAKPINQRNFKDKYTTPRSRMQMLWARVVSDAVRVICPQANQGHYTPEEVEDFAPEEESGDNGSGAHRPQPLTATAQSVPPTVTAEVCPIPGPMLGKRWDSMDATVLKKGLEFKHEAMTDDHRKAIERVLKEKQQGEQSNG